MLHLWSRYSENGPLYVSVLLAGLIVFDAIHAIMPAWQPAAAPLVAMVAPRRSAGIDVQPIVAAHLFGVLQVDSNQDPATAPPTVASLVLQATFAAKNPRSGLAIIAADGAAKVYKVGDEVNGAALHSVYPTRVILEHSGGLESLSLPRAEPSPGRMPRLAQDATDGGAEGPGGRDVHRLADVIRAEADIDESTETLLGFRIHAGPASPTFIHSGLRPGDLVTAVNGTPLANQNRQSSQEVVDAMLASGSATVSLLRNGKHIDVAVNLP
jgi:general secretion pathway protein C